ncbi:uncharacterized protein An08g11420 [Aspergillus niger]|uniref:Contig An08c0280, genomic contig n=2 Tax=Aspergillus niger TaxID=5061 RepID=A2QSP1_ASPNC|nr:uncharacterized protein An08g11420 [Aspergillus niger]CAK45813.1 unnamed protein product [Aspergillus niger]
MRWGTCHPNNRHPLHASLANVLAFLAEEVSGSKENVNSWPGKEVTRVIIYVDATLA